MGFDAFVFVMVAHFVGDFVAQTDWQAKNKAVNTQALVRHVATYGATLIVMMLILRPDPYPDFWITFNVMTHLITDAVTSQGTRYFSRKDPPDWRNFFIVVGFDQLVHTLTLTESWMLFVQGG